MTQGNARSAYVSASVPPDNKSGLHVLRVGQGGGDLLRNWQVKIRWYQLVPGCDFLGEVIGRWEGISPEGPYWRSDKSTTYSGSSIRRPTKSGRAASCRALPSCTITERSIVMVAVPCWVTKLPATRSSSSS